MLFRSDRFDLSQTVIKQTGGFDLASIPAVDEKDLFILKNREGNQGLNNQLTGDGPLCRRHFVALRKEQPAEPVACTNHVSDHRASCLLIPEKKKKGGIFRIPPFVPIYKRSHREQQFITILVPGNNQIPEGAKTDDQGHGVAVSHDVGYIDIITEISFLLKPIS